MYQGVRMVWYQDVNFVEKKINKIVDSKIKYSYDDYIVDLKINLTPRQISQHQPR